MNAKDSTTSVHLKASYDICPAIYTSKVNNPAVNKQLTS